VTLAAIRIDRLMFDLELGRGLRAATIQDRISSLCRTHLPGLLQRVIEPHPDDEMPALERLDLDLGDLPAGALESNLLQRLEAALREALQRQRRARAQGQRGRSVDDTNAEPTFAAADFLARGTLPNGQDADAVMQAALQNLPAPLLQALRHWGRLAATRHRLAHRLAQPTIERVVHLCVPTDAATVIDYTADLRRLHHSRPLVQDSEDGFGAALWEFVFAYLLADRGSHFNTRTFVAHTLRQMAARYRVEYGALLAELAHCAALLRVPFSSAFGLPEILGSLHAEQQAAQDGPPPLAASAVEQGLQRLHVFLDHGSLPAAMDGLGDDAVALADALLLQAPDRLRALIVASGRREAARRRIAQHFPQESFGRIVVLLEPADGPQIRQYLSQLRKSHTRQPVLPVDSRRFGVVLTELTLASLLLDRGSNFNRRSFVRNLLQRMAAGHHVRYSVLLANLVAHTPDAVLAQDSLLGILQSLNEEDAIGMPTVPLAPTSEEDASSLLAAWLAAAQPQSVTDAQLRAWLTLLVQQEPDYLCRLLRAANRRRPLAQRLAQACDAALAQRLLAILAPASQAAWIDCLAALQVAQESVAPDGGMAALDATFWQAAFEFLLRQSGADMHAAYRHLGQALMDKCRISAERLRALLVSGLRDGAASGGLLDALTQGSEREREPLAADDTQQLAHWLEFGILPDLASEQADLRRWLQRLDDRTLQNALRQCTPSPHLLRRLQAYGAVRTRMLRLLCAERGVPAATLQALLKQLDPGPSAAAVERLLLAALLAHSDWTPGTLLYSLLQALAPQLGVSRQGLLRQLQQALLVKRLPMSLRREAADMVASAASTAAAGGARSDGKGATSAVTPLALALDYLREGALPRWSSAANLGALRRWLMQGGLLPTNDAALTGLRALAGQRVALRRLLQYLSPNQLVQLLAALAPDFFGFVASWLLLAEDLAQDRRLGRATRRILLARHRESALTLLLREDRPQSAAAILRVLGESAAAACAIAPELYWEVLHDASARRAQADARFLPLLQTMPGKHAAQTALAAPKPSAEASTQNQVALDPIAALRRYLRFGEGKRVEVEAALLQALQSQRHALLHLLRGAAGRELERARIVFGFSANGLQQCLRLLLAQNYAPAALCIAALQMAMAALAGARGSACWGDACVDELLRCALAEFDPDVALTRFVDMAAQGFRQASGVAVAALRVRALLALEGMRSQAQPALLAAQRALATLPMQAQPEQTAPRRQPEAPPTEMPEGARLSVENAGLVLLAPYIERYFGALELLRGREFVGLRQRMRAAYLLQYLVAGKQEAPEPALLLNKILCGVGTALPLDEPEPLKASEEKLSEQLLLAVIGHWKKLGNTSMAGLRETFLMRAGYLTRRDDDWVLQVQPGPYDVLMQSLPWSIATIRLPWMERPLWVQWI